MNEQIQAEIAAYLRGEMDEKRRLIFENKIKNNPPIGTTINEYQEALETLRRKWIKEEWGQTHRMMQFRKYGYYFSAFIFILGIVLFSALKKNQQSNKNAETVNSASGVNDKEPSKNTLVSNQSVVLIDSGKLNRQAFHPVFAPSHLLSERNPNWPEQSKSIDRNTAIGDTTISKNSENGSIKNPDVVLPVALPTAIEEKKEVDVKSKTNKYNEFEPLKTQYFTIDVSRDTILNCDGGLRIFIPANSLVLEDGSATTGNVKIGVKEVLTYKDMYRNKSTTTADGSLLITGGSCEIIAKDASLDVEVKLKKNKSIKLFFPKPANGANDNMQTFYGQRDSAGVLNWKKASTAVPIMEDGKNIVKRAPFSVRAKNIFRMRKVEEKKYRLKLNTNIKYVQGSGRNGKINPDSLLFFKQYFGLLDSMSEKNKKYYENSINGTTFHYVLSPSGVVLKLDYYGQITKQQKRHIRKFSNQLRHLGGYLADSADWRKYLEGEDEFYATFTYVREEILDGRNYFIIEATNFGNINCDRFAGTSNLRDFTYTMHDSMMAAQAFFTDIKASMIATKKESKMVFANIPAKSNLMVIATGVIDGKLMMQLIKGNGKINPPEPFDFKRIISILTEIENQTPVKPAT